MLFWSMCAVSVLTDVPDVAREFQCQVCITLVRNFVVQFRVTGRVSFKNKKSLFTFGSKKMVDR